MGFVVICSLSRRATNKTQRSELVTERWLVSIRSLSGAEVSEVECSGC